MWRHRGGELYDVPSSAAVRWQSVRMPHRLRRTTPHPHETRKHRKSEPRQSTVVYTTRMDSSVFSDRSLRAGAGSQPIPLYTEQLRSPSIRPTPTRGWSSRDRSGVDSPDAGKAELGPIEIGYCGDAAGEWSAKGMFPLTQRGPETEDYR